MNWWLVALAAVAFAAIVGIVYYVAKVVGIIPDEDDDAFYENVFNSEHAEAVDFRKSSENI